MIWVEGKSPGSKTPVFAPFGFEPYDETSANDPYRVRHLIAKLVRECVRDFHLRERLDAFRVLTPEKIDQGLRQGKIGRSREEAQEIDPDEAVGQALQAFEDGLYLLFVDGHEKRTLDDLVLLQPETKIVLIRLTALAGR
jgi:hypothetical protein